MLKYVEYVVPASYGVSLRMFLKIGMIYFETSQDESCVVFSVYGDEVTHVVVNDFIDALVKIN